MSFWKKVFGRRKEAGRRLPFDGICRQSLGIDVDCRTKPAVSPTTVEMMARMRRKVDSGLEAEIVREVERLCYDGDVDGALSRSAAVARLALLKAELGIGSPEQPDLIQRGRAAAEGGCERSERWS